MSSRGDRFPSLPAVVPVSTGNVISFFTRMLLCFASEKLGSRSYVVLFDSSPTAFSA